MQAFDPDARYSTDNLIRFTEEPNRWRYAGRWIQPTLSICCYPFWSQNNAYATMGLPETSGHVLLLDGHYFALKPDFERIEQYCRKAAETENSKVFESYVATAKSTCETFLDFSKRLTTPSALYVQLRQFFELSDHLMAPWTAVFPITYGLDACLKQELSILSVNPAELIDHIVLPRPTQMVQQTREAGDIRKEFVRLGLSRLLDLPAEQLLPRLSESNAGLALRIRQHLEKYAWVGTHHCLGNPFSIAHLSEQLCSPPLLNPLNPTQPLPKPVDWLVHWQNELAYWRQYCAEVSDITFFRARPLLAEAAKALGLTYDSVVWLSDHEILAGLNGSKIPTMDEIKARQHGFGYLEGSDGERILTGSDLARLTGLLVPKPNLEQGQIRGITGSRGRAQGTAFIAFTPQQTVDMLDGQILVVPQTTPDYIFVMRRAAAIVTDEGGMTCHAVIVSRELGIPCVVGTKVATSVIQTGQKLIVDGDRGLVTKLG